MNGYGNTNGWKRRLAFAAGVGLIILWATRFAYPVADPSALKVQGPDTNAGNPLLVQTTGIAGPLSAQTAITSSQQASNTALTATLAAAAGKTTYIAGFDFYLGGATAGTVSNITVTGTIGGTLNFTETVPTGATSLSQGRSVYFNPPIPASAVNTAIVVNVPASGAGNAGQSVSAWGFQQ